MSSIDKQLEKLFKEKDIPVRRKDIDEFLVLYTVEYNLKQTHVLRLEIITEKEKESCDVQLSFRYVSLLKKYNQRMEMLDVINTLNESLTGYYKLYLANDGEIYMHNLFRSGLDVLPIYDIMIQGPAIIRNFLPQIEKVAGEFKTTDLGM